MLHVTTTATIESEFTHSLWYQGFKETYLWNMDAPSGNKFNIWQNIYVISVRFEQPFDEFTVQVWLLYRHRNFKAKLNQQIHIIL